MHRQVFQYFPASAKQSTTQNYMVATPFVPVSTTYCVHPDDLATFRGVTIHYVCSTFALAREFEYAGRLVYESGQQADEQAIGVTVAVEHLAPAFVGTELEIEATPISFSKGVLACKVSAYSAGKLIATGQTTQKVLPASTIKRILTP
jgi:fluoroacetyl-CoA thioesterase